MKRFKAVLGEFFEMFGYAIAILCCSIGMFWLALSLFKLVSQDY